MNAALRSAGFSPLQRQVFSGMSAYFRATIWQCSAAARTSPRLLPQHRFDKDSRRLIQLHCQRLVRADPLKRLGLVVQLNPRLANAAAGVIQQNKMGVPIKFSGMDAILEEH